MTKTIIAACLLCFASTEALLPPLYESINQYKAFLEDSELSNRLDSADNIQSIEHRDDRFLMKTSKGKQLEARIVFDAQEMPGPGRFHFQFIDQKNEIPKYPHWGAMDIPASSSRTYRCCEGNHYTITFVNNYSFQITLWGRQDEGILFFKVLTSHGWSREHEISRGSQTIVIEYD